jgi:putative phosphoesterase
MEKIFVFSDLHGDRHALQSVEDRIVAESADQVVFAGDAGIERLGLWQSPLLHTKAPMIMVRGNCDTSWAFSDANIAIPPIYRTLEFDGRTLFITHGHLFPYQQGLPLELTEHDVFICGHSHRAQLFQEKENPIYLNPGSVSRPRDRIPPTYAIITKQEITIRLLKNGECIKTLQFPR